MVHKKYIKRGDKVFGPYLYENYRESGKVKTRYLGKGEDFGERGSDKNKIWLTIGICILLILLIGSFVFFQRIDKDLGGVLFSEKGFLYQLFSERTDIFIDVVGNHPPEILDIEDEIYICENKRLKYFFDVLDEDGDALNVVIDPPNPFFVSFEQKKSDIISEYKIISGVVDIDDINRRRSDDEGWAVYEEEVSATDGIDVDYVKTNIIIIEVNDAPDLKNIGAQTIWTKGDNSVFEYYVNVSDEEDLDLGFNLSFLNSKPFFEINKSGFMYLKGDENLILEGNSSVYYLRVCVNDSGLNKIIHPEINLCLPDDVIGLTVCDDFSLTVTKENRAPEIVSYYPKNLSLSVRGDDSLYFNVSVYDADRTLPDVYWYVDNELVEHDENNSIQELVYSFGCNVKGMFVIEAFASDGELNDSVKWNVSVEMVGCKGVSPSGGGGGGGFFCNEEWVCENWVECKNLDREFKEGKISKYFERIIKERCNNFSYSNENCGYQIRNCTDLENCRSNLKIPGTIKECYYTENPRCDDEIKNCHTGSCEILVDCGGPCQPCPTCDDGIKNQGEMDVDCGGPCPICVEEPLRDINLVSLIVIFSLIGVLILFVFFIYYELRRRKKAREELGKRKKKEFRFSGVHLYCVIVLILLLALGGFWKVLGADYVVVDVGREGFLGTQNLFNVFLRGFAEVFSISIIETVIGDNADLVVWDDTDDINNIGVKRFTEGALYGKTESDWMIYFYANYTDKSRNAINSANGNGQCTIKFYDSDFISMNFNLTSLLWEYNRSFDDKGELDFEIDCSSDYEDLNLATKVKITNTPPQINLNLPIINVFFEDEILSYDFSQRVREDDKNDVLLYNLKNISGMNPLFYDWIWVDGNFIFVNATSEVETGDYELGIEVTDSNNEAVSRTQLISINPNNDAPRFVGLGNESFNAGDLFERVISVDDEENNVPFSFEMDFMSCDNEAVRGNCTLFDYTNDGFLNISFIPNVIDLGEYIINFSVTDTNSLGDRTGSQVVKFRVVAPIWKEPLVLDYDLVEDERFYLNLSELIREEYRDDVVFSYERDSASFSLVEGVIDFIPLDEDVGYYEVEIVANSGADSPKSFSFNISNIDDEVGIVRPLIAGGVLSIDENSNIEVLENAQVEIYLFADDDDFKIPQKSFYDEELEINLEIEGPNPDLFEFVFDSLILDNRGQYNAEFIPREGDVGDYEIGVNVSDKRGNSDFLQFNLTVVDRDYDKPSITYPDDVEFELEEGVRSELVFRANHSVGDDLMFKFYIDGLVYESFGPGDNSDFVWGFTPGYDNETYGKVKELKLVVLNKYFPELNNSRSWNLTIEHANAPVEFIRDIGDKMLPYTYSLMIDLKEHFSDVDYLDSHYNQSVAFEFTSNSSESYINVGKVLDDWTVTLSSSKYATYSEILSITASDLNMSNKSQILTTAVSNDFVIEFIEPPTVHVPTSGGGGVNPISLKIITPREISGYEGETIEIPLTLFNSGKTTFYDLSLESSAFKDGGIFNEIETSLDRKNIKTLRRDEKENLTLRVFFGTDKIGRYEILVNVSSKSPRYTDWAKIHINLERINESEIRELMVFTEEFIVQNPACVEIREVVDEAKKFFDKGDLVNAKEKSESALNACKENIEQVSVPRKKDNFYKFGLYLFLACLTALIAGFVYYWKRRRFIKGSEKIETKKRSEKI